MTEPEQNIAENGSEQQSFPGSESEQQCLAGNELEQQCFGLNDCEQQTFRNESENENFSENESEQEIAGNESEQNFAGTEIEQDHVENEFQKNFSGNELRQDFAENEHIVMKEVSEIFHPEEKQEGQNNAVVATKKWPGWPGESVFRMLVPVQKVGNIIGRKGEYIKKIVEETRARIKILDGPPGIAERAVMVSAKEEPDASLPPAIDGLLRVHKRIVEGLESDSSLAVASAGGKVSTRMLVPATQVGSLIGKQGSTVKSIQETSNCIVRVLGREDLPVFALQDDRVVEVVGEPASVHKTMELIASHLRRFLVDRSIIPIFEMQMQTPNIHMEHMPPRPAWGPPHGLPPNAGRDRGYVPGPQYMPPTRQLDNYYPPAEMPPLSNRQPHPRISTYGREPPLGGHASSNPQPPPTMITQVTQHTQIPLSCADTVIGAGGANISYIRHASGATVTIEETRGVPGEMTVGINGTAAQVQAAQQLIQNFMAEAAAPSQTQPAGSADQGYNQGYNSYAAPVSTYGSPPESTGYASQPGAYGSVHDGNYGY
ncbi:hypothetical protein Nepgr_001434 [Nepenthes gracilis]|uniref:K Homology domain-containing protein n=1 Tax=Nepenthes gracilis TaxID=150966 RepID=A0AAD3P2P4_NEPGR|nr:hypothetical protein Nepgr_001434 [Nepenthes gracilis]